MSYSRNQRRKNIRRIKKFGICAECEIPFKNERGIFKFQEALVHWECVPDPGPWIVKSNEVTKISLHFPTIEQAEMW